MEDIIYPNPNTGKFNLEFCMEDLKEKSVVIEIINTVGKIIYNKIPPKNNGCIHEAIELDSDLPTGIYTLKVSIDGKIKTSKILLTR